MWFCRSGRPALMSDGLFEWRCKQLLVVRRSLGRIADVAEAEGRARMERVTCATSERTQQRLLKELLELRLAKTQTLSSQLVPQFLCVMMRVQGELGTTHAMKTA